MILDEAIGILNSLERTLAPTMAASGTDAIKLSIEGLKAIIQQRLDPYPDPIAPLPGETKE